MMFDIYKTNPFLDGRIEAENLLKLGVGDYLQAVASGEGLPIWTDLQEQLDDCAQNPDRRHIVHDPSFRVFVPVSGGLDSMTALAMAINAGHNVCAVNVNTGAEYSAREAKVISWNIESHLNAIRDDGSDQQLTFHKLNVPVGYKKYEHVDRGRNLIAIVAIAELALTKGWWGELWFGNVAEYGESGVIAGDKSHRFFIEMNVLLRSASLPVEVRSPLGALDKTDLLRWWFYHCEDAHVWLQNQWSCHSDNSEHCGSCSGCWSRWVAFKELSMDAIPSMPEIDFSAKLQLAKDRWSSSQTTSLAHSKTRLIRYLTAMGVDPKKM